MFGIHLISLTIFFLSHLAYSEVAVDERFLYVCPTGREIDETSCLDLPNVDSRYDTGGRADTWAGIASGCFRNAANVVYYNLKSADSRNDHNHPLLCRPDTSYVYLGSDIEWNSCTTGWGKCLVDSDYAGHKDQIEINGKFWDKGIVQHAAGAIEFTLNSKFDRFHACIGISKYSSDARCGVTVGDARFKVLGDGSTLRDWEEKGSPQDATCFAVSITGITTLTLQTDLNGSRDCDLSTWADAKVSLLMDSWDGSRIEWYNGMANPDPSTFSEFTGSNWADFWNTGYQDSLMPSYIDDLTGAYGNKFVNQYSNKVVLPQRTLVLLGRHPGWTMPADGSMCDGNCPVSSWIKECTGHFKNYGSDCNDYTKNSLFSKVFEPGTYMLGSYSAMYLFLPASEGDELPKGDLLIMKMKAGSDVFDYESSYWTNLETLNPDETTASESDDIDAKLEAFNEVPLDALKICYGELENCYTYDLGQSYDSAQVLFSGGYIKDINLGGTSPDAAKEAFTDIFIPPTDSMYNTFWNGGHGHGCAMQRPGINTQCNDNNWARVGYCVNLPGQSCQPSDSNDADSPIGIGLKTQNWPNSVNAPFGEYALHGIGTSGVQERQKQVWVFIPGAAFPRSEQPSLSPTLPYCSAFDCGDSNDAVHIPNAAHVFGNDFATCCKCQFGKDILWGAHASGVFHDDLGLVEMWVEIPVDVDMQKIFWKNSRNNDLQFVKGTSSRWEYESEGQCRARWVLEENLGTFFSAATHFTYDKAADVLEGMIEFEADREVTRSTTGHHHSFIRHITQDIPVQFSLEKRANVSATFSTAVGAQYADIAITGIAEQSFAENGTIVLVFNILSSSCMDSSVTKLKSGQQYVDGSLNVEWSEKSLFRIDEGTSCSQDVTVRFQRQSGEYNLELVFQFQIQGGDEIETTVNLHIEEPSILDTLPIEATMSFYLTEDRTTTADSFGLGHVVYGRIVTSTVVSVDYIGVTRLFLEQMGYEGTMESHDIMNVDWSGYSGAYVSPDKFDFSFVLNTTELHITAADSGDDHLASVIADIEVTYLDESSTAGRRRRLAVGKGSDMSTSSSFKISDGNELALVAVESANKQNNLLPYAAIGGTFALTFYCVRRQMKLQDQAYFPLLIDDDEI